MKPNFIKNTYKPQASVLYPISLIRKDMEESWMNVEVPLQDEKLVDIFSRTKIKFWKRN